MAPTHGDARAAAVDPDSPRSVSKSPVRNFREGHGNVGIIRSPLRAIALPDQSSVLISLSFPRIKSSQSLEGKFQLGMLPVAFGPKNREEVPICISEVRDPSG